MPCPHCASTATTERPQPTWLGHRTFRCRAGTRRFDERAGTPFNFLEQPTNLVLPWEAGRIPSNCDQWVIAGRE